LARGAEGERGAALDDCRRWPAIREDRYLADFRARLILLDVARDVEGLVEIEACDEIRGRLSTV
jgi:hypothetical protein